MKTSRIKSFYLHVGRISLFTYQSPTIRRVIRHRHQEPSPEPSELSVVNREISTEEESQNVFCKVEMYILFRVLPYLGVSKGRLPAISRLDLYISNIPTLKEV